MYFDPRGEWFVFALATPGGMAAAAGTAAAAARYAAIGWRALKALHKAIQQAMAAMQAAQKAMEMAEKAKEQEQEKDKAAEEGGSCPVTSPDTDESPDPDDEEKPNNKGGKKEPWTPSETERHHTIPKEIQKKLPPEVRNHPDVKGRRGLPNRKAIPYKKHREIHQGRGGGHYNQRFDEEIARQGGYENVGPRDLTSIRDQLVNEFGL